MKYDEKILKNMLFNKDFKILNRKYYLTDIRYYNIYYFLYSYYGICYHLKEQKIVDKNLVNKKKLFNFYYSSFYNMVEKNFGVTKWQFQIFKLISKYHFNI